MCTDNFVRLCKLGSTHNLDNAKCQNGMHKLDATLRTRSTDIFSVLLIESKVYYKFIGTIAISLLRCLIQRQPRSSRTAFTMQKAIGFINVSQMIHLQSDMQAQSHVRTRERAHIHTQTPLSLRASAREVTNKKRALRRIDKKTNPQANALSPRMFLSLFISPGCKRRGPLLATLLCRLWYTLCKSVPCPSGS